MLKKTLFGSLIMLAIGNAAASPVSPEESVQQFYMAAASNSCELAAKLRPGFSTERCEKLSDANIRSLSALANDGENAVVALDIGVISGGSAQDFNGYIHLQKQQGEWVLLDYAEAASTKAADYISRHVKGGETTYITATDKQEASATSPQQAAPASTADVISDNPAETLAMLRTRFPAYINGKIALVDVDKQRISIYQGEQKLGEFPVSTATKGMGSKAGSDKTPLGAHRISQKFGDNARKGSIFKARQDTGTLADIITEPKDVPTDYVTTRILWLDGLEPGKNKGGNVDSQERFIYIHGTPEEGLIGQPASHGCIRMKNDDVLKVYQLLDTDTLVYIGE